MAKVYFNLFIMPIDFEILSTILCTFFDQDMFIYYQV